MSIELDERIIALRQALADMDAARSHRDNVQEDFAIQVSMAGGGAKGFNASRPAFGALGEADKDLSNKVAVVIGIVRGIVRESA